MHTTIRGLSVAATLWLAACTQAVPPAEANTVPSRQLERAGQPIDPLKTTAHMAAFRVSAMTGDQAGAQHQFDAMHHDLMRSMKLPDPERRIEPEAARTAARNVPGVRSVAWLDRSNLLVRVQDIDWRTQATIDEVCYRLQPLGDTLAVVVHLQSATARSRDDLDTLSRNCQLAPGDRAFLQRDRTVDALDPSLRAQMRTDADRMRSQRREMSAGDRAALEAIPEM